MPTFYKRWFKEHSLSLSLTAGFLIASWISYQFAEDAQKFWYDFFLNLGAGFGTAAIIFIFSRFFWEKDATPDKPPPKGQNTSD